MNTATTALDGTELDGRTIYVRGTGAPPPERNGRDGGSFAATPCSAWQKGRAAETSAASALEKPSDGQRHGQRSPEFKVFCGSLG
jgi:hypothetical protein